MERFSLESSSAGDDKAAERLAALDAQLSSLRKQAEAGGPGLFSVFFPLQTRKHLCIWHASVQRLCGASDAQLVSLSLRQRAVGV